MRDTEAEIQLPLKRFPDSSVSSLIPTGWCGRASHRQKLAPTFPWDRQLPYGNVTGFSRNGSVIMTEREVPKCC